MPTDNPLLRALAQAEAAASGPARTWLARLRHEGEVAQSPQDEEEWFQRVCVFVSHCQDAAFLSELLPLIRERLAQVAGA